MRETKYDRKLSYYKCGKCGGRIGFEIGKQPKPLCPECGYSYRLHGTRKVNDIPSTIKLYFNDLNHT